MTAKAPALHAELQKQFAQQHLAAREARLTPHRTTAREAPPCCACAPVLTGPAQCPLLSPRTERAAAPTTPCTLQERGGASGSGSSPQNKAKGVSEGRALASSDSSQVVRAPDVRAGPPPEPVLPTVSVCTRRRWTTSGCTTRLGGCCSGSSSRGGSTSRRRQRRRRPSEGLSPGAPPGAEGGGSERLRGCWRPPRRGSAQLRRAGQESTGTSSGGFLHHLRRRTAT